MDALMQVIGHAKSDSWSAEGYPLIATRENEYNRWKPQARATSTFEAVVFGVI